MTVTKKQLLVGLGLVLLMIGGATYHSKNSDRLEGQQDGKAALNANIYLENQRSRSIDYRMTAQGFQVHGTAVLGRVFQKVQDGITYTYQSAGNTITFRILNKEQRVLAEQAVKF